MEELLLWENIIAGFVGFVLYMFGFIGFEELLVRKRLKSSPDVAEGPGFGSSQEASRRPSLRRLAPAMHWQGTSNGSELAHGVEVRSQHERRL